MDEVDGIIRIGTKNGISAKARLPGSTTTNMAVRRADVGHHLPPPNTNSSKKINQEELKNTAKSLGLYIVHYVAKTKELEGNSVPDHGRTLTRTVDEISSRHDILFKGMVNRLGVEPENLSETFTNIADEIFRDGQHNWGRVVSLYAFAGRLSRHCEEQGMVECVDNVGHLVGDYVANKLGWWISKQGGWDAFDEHFPEQHSFEEKVWRGLLFTAVGLGALATMVAVR